MTGDKDKYTPKCWNDIVQQINEGAPYEEIMIDLLTPMEIVSGLNKTVIDQRKAKQLISIAVYNRLLSFNNKRLKRDADEYFFEKNNVLLLGNTGCGKTHLVKSLANVVSLPVTIQDATGFTSAGYVGRDVDTCISDLLSSAEVIARERYGEADVKKQARSNLAKELTEYGIIYIDEADKIRTSGGAGKDVNGKSVQEAFLRMLEGSKIHVRGRDYSGLIDTTNILFIFGGAFSELDKIIDARVNSVGIGFNAKIKEKGDRVNILEKACVQDFTKFGMIPELMGRLPTVAILREVDAKMVRRIFTEPKNSIYRQVQNEFKSFNVKFELEEDAINYIIEEALKLKIGARGLKSVCQNILRPLYYVLPSAKKYHGTTFKLSKEQLIRIMESGV